MAGGVGRLVTGGRSPAFRVRRRGERGVHVLRACRPVPFVLRPERDMPAEFPPFTGPTGIGLDLLTGCHRFLPMVFFLKALQVLHPIQAARLSCLIAAIRLGEPRNSLALPGGALVLGRTLAITRGEELRRQPTPA